MFLSLPQFEFQMPAGLSESDSGGRYWRAIQITLHAPWFMLTIEAADSGDADFYAIHTLCVACETDLADVIKADGAKRIRGLVAMVPGWASPSGQWSSRQITEVWLNSGDGGPFVTLIDVAGKKLDAGIRDDMESNGLAGELLLRLSPKKRRTQRPRGSASGRRRRRSEPAR
ncbi:MAG: hypothetical protein HY020_06915 [Burkholderiales bacterium]|nr:hypothetical protein [Burkholderiales bacterium]